MFCSALRAGMAATPTATPTPVSPRLHQVTQRLNQQWKLVKLGVKNEKISKEEAVELRGNLKSIQLKEIIDYKNSPNHELTPDQQNDLNALMDKNSGLLEEGSQPSN